MDELTNILMLLENKTHDVINWIHGEFNNRFPEESQEHKDALQGVVDEAHKNMSKFVQELTS